MATLRLTVPWLGSSACDPADVGTVLAAVGTDAPTEDHKDLLTALRYARERVGVQTDAATFAQAVLELAVEWRMAAVERWAAAWLTTTGSDHLRLRWSSRSRDGRLRRELRVGASVTALGGRPGSLVIGTWTGAVEEWSPTTGLTALGQLDERPVTTLACAEGRVFAGGPHASFFAEGWSSQPDLRPRRAALTASTVGAAVADGIACGDELGWVMSWDPDRGWWERTHPHGTRSVPVRAVALRGSVLRAAWADGTIAEWDTAAGEHAPWRNIVPTPGGIGRAAWDDDALRFTHRAAGRVRDLAWTSRGPAVARAHTVELPEHTLTSDTGIGHIATVRVAGVEYLCSSSGTKVVLWNLAEAGSADPLEIPGDAVTAIGTDAQRSRLATGSRFGQLREYDTDGNPLDGPTRLRPDGRVHDIAPLGEDEWLVGAQTGAFRWRPGAPATRVADGLCQAVAVLDDRRYAVAQLREVQDHDGRNLLSMPATVRDLRPGPAGNLVALAEDGTVTFSAGPDATARRSWAVPPDSRLVSVADDGEAVVMAPGAMLAVSPNAGVRTVAAPPAGITDATVLGADVVGVHPAVELVTVARDGRLTATPTQVAVVRSAGDRLVGAGGSRLLGYDRARATRGTPGLVTVNVLSVRGRTTMEVEGYDRVRLTAGQRDALQASAGSVDELSRLVLTAEAIGTSLWEAGLAVEIDRARGPDPYGLVRLEWHLNDFPSTRPADPVNQEVALDDLAWELLHPYRSPLGWFGDPPVTSVRVISSGAPLPPRPRRRPSLLVLRGVHREINEADAAFERIVRRTRRLNVTMRPDGPVQVDGPERLTAALAGNADVVHLWAHCNPTHVEFSPGHREPVDTLAERLARLRPQLVVLVGCRSTALGRRLVEQGVPAVVGMRLAVYGHAVTPLVEELTAGVLAGTAVDLAFARALRSHVDTGHPGAAAVPVVHLAAGRDPILFPPTEAS